MRSLVISLLFPLLLFKVSAQVPLVKQWDGLYGGDGTEDLFSLQQTKDGGFILGGNTTSNKSGDVSKGQCLLPQTDYWIIKTDSLGIRQWDSRCNGVSVDYLQSVKEAKNGGFIYGGWTISDIGCDKSQSRIGPVWDMWVVKTDSVGNKLWDRTFGGMDDDRLYDLQATSDGGCIMGGFTWSNPSGDVTGFSRGGLDYWVVKLNEAGQKQWQMRYGGGGTDIIRSVVQTHDGGYVFGGYSASSPPSYEVSESSRGGGDYWILKTDSLGNRQWDKTIFSVGVDYGGYAIQTRDGCYAVATSTFGGIGGYQTHANRDGGKDSTLDYWVVKFCMEPYNAVDNLSEEEKKVLVYPNPFSSDVSIAIEKEGISEATFTISNSVGQIIYHRKETNLDRHYTKNLDLSFLPNGIYFIEVSSPSNMQGGEPFREVKRVVKE